MKKLFAILLTLFCALSVLPFAAFAEDKPTIYELSKQWLAYGYPDNVGGVCVRGDVTVMYVSLVDMSETKQDEIMTLVSNPDAIKFEKATYSYHELLAVKNEIALTMGLESGVYSASINAYDNNVYVTVDDEVLDKYTKEYAASYGDKVSVEAGEPDTRVGAYANIESKITAKELYQQWRENGYPDDVGGMDCYDVLKSSIYLVNATDAREDEIRTLLSDSSNVSFYNVTYSSNQLLTVQDEINKDKESDGGISSVSINLNKNRVEVTVGKDIYDQYSADYAARYGDMAYMLNSDAAVTVTAFQLYSQWEANGYPDDVGGVWFNSTGYDIYLVNATETRKNEILSMVSNPDTVTFIDARYSYNELKAVRLEIEADMSNNSDFVHAGFAAWENCVLVELNDTVSDEVYNQCVEKYKTLYGDRVSVSIAQTLGRSADEETYESYYASLPLYTKLKWKLLEARYTWPWLFPTLITMAVLVIIAIFLFIRSRRVRAKQIAGGGIVKEYRKLSRKETIQAVKEMTIEQDDTLFQSIMKDIDH